MRYTNVMPPENDPESGMGRSWRSTLNVGAREDAEARLAKLGYEAEWLPDGFLRAATPVLPAVRTLASGRKVFFNQLIAAFQGWKDSRNDPSKEGEKEGSTLYLTTTVTVYRDVQIADYDAEITMPVRIQNAEKSWLGRKLQFRYRISGSPGLVWEIRPAD